MSLLLATVPVDQVTHAVWRQSMTHKFRKRFDVERSNDEDTARMPASDFVSNMKWNVCGVFWSYKYIVFIIETNIFWGEVTDI